MTDLLLQDPHIPVAYRNAKYDDYAHEAWTQAVRKWTPTQEKPNLVLWGKPGLGKTFLAVAAINERQNRWTFKTKSNKPVPEECLPMLRQSKCPAYFIQLAELVEMHKKLFDLRELDPDAYMEQVSLLEDIANKAKWLVIDDVGKEYATSSGFSVATFDLLVRTRFNNGFNTIFTSNLPLSHWASDYSDSMRDFIKRTAEIIKFSE